MKYEFPRIAHINDVKPYVENDPAFGVMERGPFTVINYHYQDSETFTGPHEAIRRECRGLIFDLKTGVLLNRRFHKFFNVNEKADTQAELLDWNSPHIIMEKLDGSMVSPVAVEGDLNCIRWTTKMGITDIAMSAENFVSQRQKYVRLARMCLKNNATPIFEWCSNKSRIVIDHAEDNLYLLAIRENYAGDYYFRSQIQDLADLYDIPYVDTRETKIGDSSFLARAKEEEGKEGYVIQFMNGHMVKVKSDWYVGIHRAKDMLNNPRLVIQHALNHTLDDLMAVLPPDDRAKAEGFIDEFWERVNQVTKGIATGLRLYQRDYTRKDFALKVAPNTQYAPVYFTCWEGGVTIRDALLRQISKTLTSDTNYREQFPKLLGDIPWSK